MLTKLNSSLQLHPATLWNQASKVKLIRQLIQTKSPEAATVTEAWKTTERQSRDVKGGQEVELYLAEAPAVFLCLSCLLALVPLTGSQRKFRFGENLPSSLMSSSERDAAWSSSGVGKMQRSFLFAGEKSKESDRSRALKGFWVSVFFFCFSSFFATMLLSVNFNCSFHLITSLTSSFSSACSLFLLLLRPSATNVYLSEQRSLHLLTEE